MKNAPRLQSTELPCTCVPTPRRWLTAAVVAVCCGTGPSLSLADTHVASVDGLLRLDLEDLLAVRVVTASRTAESALNAPAPVAIVTAEEIRTQGHRTLGDILRTLPGLSVSYDRQYQYLGVRGINRKDFNSRILVLIDGRRTNENVYDQAFIDLAFALDVEAIERVEFVAGPGSSLYGNNAMLGVVNVVTRQPAGAADDRVLAEWGSASSARLMASFGRQLESGHRWSVSASAARREGRDLVFSEHAATQGGRAAGMDGETVRKVQLGFQREGLRLQARHMERTKDDPTALYGSVFGDPAARFTDQTTHLGVSLERALSPQMNLTAQWGLNRYRYSNQYHFALATPDPVNQDETRGQWWNASAQVAYTGWAGHRIVAGAEFQRDVRQDYSNVDVAPAYSRWQQTGSARRLALFVDDAWTPAEAWQLHLGVRLDRSDTRTDIRSCDPAMPADKACASSAFTTPLTRWSPRGGLVYRPGPATSLKFLWARAFRAPNPSEMGYVAPSTGAVIGSASPERFVSRDLIAEHFVHANFRLSANLFRYDLMGVIGPDASNRPVNQADLRSQGLVLAMDWKSPRNHRVRAGLLQTRVSSLSSGQGVDDAPRRVAQFSVGVPLAADRWRLGTEWLAQASRLTAAGQTVPGTAIGNLTLSTNRFWRDTDLSFSIYNLFNRRHADPAQPVAAPVDRIEQDGRSLRVQWAYRF